MVIFGLRMYCSVIWLYVGWNFFVLGHITVFRSVGFSYLWVSQVNNDGGIVFFLILPRKLESELFFDLWNCCFVVRCRLISSIMIQFLKYVNLHSDRWTVGVFVKLPFIIYYLLAMRSDCCSMCYVITNNIMKFKFNSSMKVVKITRFY